MQAQAANHYLRQRVETASPAELIELLYDAGIGAIRAGLAATARDEREEANRQLIRAQDVVMELRFSLNPEAGEIAQNLDAIYVYVFGRLVEANVQKNVAAGQEAMELLQSLQSAWREACRSMCQPAPAPA